MEVGAVPPLLKEKSPYLQQRNCEKVMLGSMLYIGDICV
jgi:hypothetical protein